MGTDFNEIYDNFMVGIEDYRLDTLYSTSPTDFAAYLEGFLVQAIQDFYTCNQSLGYSSGAFTETLTQENISILSSLMRKVWLEKEIKDIKQMNMSLQDKDFKRYAEANNLTAKQRLLILVMEEISLKLTQYEIRGVVDWSAWYTGNYFTPS